MFRILSCFAMLFLCAAPLPAQNAGGRPVHNQAVRLARCRPVGMPSDLLAGSPSGPPSLNRCTYAAADPVNGSDPTGQAAAGNNPVRRRPLFLVNNNCFSPAVLAF